MSIKPTLDELRACWKLLNRRPRIGALPILHPYEIDLVEQRRDEYLGDLQLRLQDGTYRPSGAPVGNVPKGNGGIRPSHILSLADRIVYAWVGLTCLPNIKAELGSDHRFIDFSYRLYDPTRPDRWFHDYYRPWREFIQASVRLIEEGATVIVESDIAAFYENIDYAILFSELTRIAIPTGVQNLLRRLLTTWFPGTKRGLPQSHPTSHLLSKFYLSSIDRQLSSLTPYRHKRFSDDIRFFCNSTVEGKLALQEFIALLRDKTLNVQSAKTKFMTPSEAKAEFLGATPLIDAIRQNYEAAKFSEVESIIYGAEYMSVADVIEASRDEAIPPAVLWQAYDDLVRGKTGKDFAKGIFHFLLGQLGKAHDRHAIDDCLVRFVDQPQETENILQYLAAVDVGPTEDGVLLDFLELEDNIYAFQTFQFLQFYRHKGTHDVNRLRSIARRFAFAAASPPYLRSEARSLLAIFGTSTDLEAMLRSYAEARNDLECAELICALEKLEIGRRNSFFSTVTGSSWIVDRATEWTRSREANSLARKAQAPDEATDPSTGPPP